MADETNRDAGRSSGPDMAAAPSPASPSLSIEAGGEGELIVAGVVDLATAEQLSGHLERVLDSPELAPTTVRLDLSSVDFLDSTGVRALLGGARTATERGASLVVGAMSVPVRQVLEVAGVLHLLDGVPAPVPPEGARR